MATYYMDNYTGQYVTKPAAKMPPGEVAGRRRCLFDTFTLTAAVLNGEQILAGYLPKGARVLSAQLHVSKSLGATGIFTLGWLVTSEDAADADGFVGSCDAGGQSALTRMVAGQAGLHKKFEAETQVVINCTEDMDGNVLDGEISFDIEYVVD